ncbi:MAG: DUF167 domain-containing protein [Planctomycetota bacterium]
MIGEHADGATLRVRVSPGARRERILGPHGDALKVAVRAPAERGRANKELCRLIADALGLAPRDVEVIRGATARDKVLLLRGLEPHLVTFDAS